MTEYKEGDKVKCIAHSGHAPFWQPGTTPEIGEIVTLGERLGIANNDEVIYRLIEYPKTWDNYDQAFNLRDFELVV